jgi:hypothetical protein
MAFADTIGAVATIANLSPGSTIDVGIRDQFLGSGAGGVGAGRDNAGPCRQTYDSLADQGSPMKMRDCFRLSRKLRLF